MSTAVPMAEEAPSRLLSRRVAAGLGVVVFAHALLVCLAVLPGQPLAGLYLAGLLPEVHAGLALGLALLLAPLWCAAPGAAAARLARAAFVGVWQAGALGFFLLLASRLAPIEAGEHFRCLLLVAVYGTLAVLLAGSFERAYAGLTFLWAIVPPVAVYLCAEVFLTTTAGGASWEQAGGPASERLKALFAWVFIASPGTAVVGALDGRLPGGMAFGWGETAAGVGFATVLAGVLLFVGRQSVLGRTPKDGESGRA